MTQLEAMKRTHVLITFLLAVLFAPAASAYDPPVATAGPLTVRIHEPLLGAYGSGGFLHITQPEMAVPVRVTLENSATAPISGVVRVQVIDRWRIEPASRPFSVAPKDRSEISFTAFHGEGTFNAHYPVHVFAEFEHGGKRMLAHPVLILQTEFYNPPRSKLAVEWKPVEVPSGGSLALWRLPLARESASVASEPQVGATGRELHQFAPAVRPVRRVQRGTWREAVAMTLGPRPPSMRERVESAAVEYPLQLPADKPVALRFAAAIDDRGGPVTFRVAAAETLFERRVSAKVWEEAEVDLSALAGRNIVLRLEAKSEGATATEAYWGEPAVSAGAAPEPVPFPPPAGAKYQTIGVLEGKERFEVRLWPGRRGVLDSTIGFVAGSKQILFRGFRVQVLEDSLEDLRSSSVFVEAREEAASERYRVRHRFRSWAGPFDVVTELWTEGAALRVFFRLDRMPPPQPWLQFRIEQLTAGPWSEPAQRVYGGPGNVIVEPQAFRLSFDGHNMATSFVGLDFPGGVSMVQGSDFTPTALEVDPERRLYSLEAAGEVRLAFIPALNVWEGVKAWRGFAPRASAGVEKLAGRFVFDLWGFETTYGKGAEQLKRAFRYGLTDAVVVWHNWQRWGYDYRLPDIWPPNPEFGKLEEFVTMARLCQQNGVYFAPHDNYIDFYPDAEGFSYDHIAFNRDGTPYKAWFMGERKAQSYRFRADRVRPFLERNVRLIRDGLAPTAYFIDVWSSIGPYDYWTSDGRFFDREVTRRAWGESFAWIREFLGGAPQISEAGHDQLIGYLDGAQANQLRVDPSAAAPFTWRIRCKDAERIPWFDAAYHDRFILHGAGYPGRYEGGLDEATHGIYSDDYIATEVLTGRPAMVAHAFGRDVVRKYWLTHDLMRSLALRRID